MGKFVAGTGSFTQQRHCSLVTKKPVAVGTNTGAAPCLVYAGSEESEQLKLWGRVWAEQASERRKREPQMV